MWLRVVFAVVGIATIVCQFGYDYSVWSSSAELELSSQLFRRVALGVVGAVLIYAGLRRWNAKAAPVIAIAAFVLAMAAEVAFVQQHVAVRSAEAAAMANYSSETVSALVNYDKLGLRRMLAMLQVKAADGGAPVELTPEAQQKLIASLKELTDAGEDFNADIRICGLVKLDAARPGMLYTAGQGGSAAEIRRAVAIEVLANVWPDEQALRVTVACLRHPDSKVRMWATIWLQAYGDFNILPALLMAANDQVGENAMTAFMILDGMLSEGVRNQTGSMDPITKLNWVNERLEDFAWDPETRKYDLPGEEAAGDDADGDDAGEEPVGEPEE